MVASPLTAPAILPQGIQLLPPGQSRLQVQQQSSLESLYQDQHYSHQGPEQQQQQQQQQLDDMAGEFLVQDIADHPTGITQGSPVFMPLQQQQHHHHQHHHQQHQHHSGELEEELNIYDYIHAKQEDEDDDAHQDSLSSMLLDKDNTVVADISPEDSRSSLRQSPVSSASSPAISIHSPPSPSPSLSSLSSGAHLDLATDPLNGEDGAPALDSVAIGAIHIKQESVDSPTLLNGHSFMDSGMDVYISEDSSLLPPPPHQDLFRTLMEELQTQAAIQREKFYSATTGSGTGMDSVDFLFNVPQSQPQAQAQLSASTQTKPVPNFTMETVADPKMVLTDASSVHALPQQSDASAGSNLELSPMQLDAPSIASDVVSALSTALKTGIASASGVTDDVMMETAEPEGDLPSSPTYSSTSSGSVTPELTSPSLPPTNTMASGTGYSPVSRSSDRTEIARVTFTRIVDQHSATAMSDASGTLSITELSLQSESEQRSTARRSSEAWKDELEDPSIIAIQPAPAKRRRLSHHVDTQRSSISPTLNALPSPPSSVRTTPPLQPVAVDMSSNVDALRLPPSCIEQDEKISATQLISPTSPSPPSYFVRPASPSGRRGMASDGSDTASLVDTLNKESTLDRKPVFPNASNKRPWTTEEEKLLLQLVDNMTPIKDIAETLNRSVHSVRSRRQVLTDPGFVKGNGHAQPRRSKPDPSSKLPTYSQMAFLSLARLHELQGTLNDVASMVEKLFSRHLNRIPRTGHKNLQIWRAQISDALAHEKGHPRPRFESFGVKRGRQWVYRLTDFGKGVMEAMGGVDQICDDLLKNNEMAGAGLGPDGESTGAGGAGAGLGQGNGYGYSYCPDAVHKVESGSASLPASSSSRKSSMSSASSLSDKDSCEEVSAESIAASNAIANAMAAMAAGLAAMTAAEDEKHAAAALASPVLKAEPVETTTLGMQVKERVVRSKHGAGVGDTKLSASPPSSGRQGRKAKA
ncbi:hypothetical protein BGZ98_008491 [Dissophora globulifera]|nr:hypothetical protein BGZ98_008491 [Dissophora globulifera]